MILRVRCPWLAAALFLGILPLSFEWAYGSLTFLMLRDHPVAAVASWALAALALIGYLQSAPRDGA